MSEKAKRMNVFERYLSLWVAVCMVLGVAIGKLAPGLVGAMRDMEFGTGSHINIPIAILIWLMIYPMMLKIDFASLKGVGKRPGGLVVTLVVNWLVKPFSMAFLGWLFFRTSSRPGSGPSWRASTSRASSSWRPRRARRWSSSGPISRTAIPPTRSCRWR